MSFFLQGFPISPVNSSMKPQVPVLRSEFKFQRKQWGKALVGPGKAQTPSSTTGLPGRTEQEENNERKGPVGQQVSGG